MNTLTPQEQKQRELYALYYRQTHHISSLKDLPQTAHYAVLESASRSYPDPYEDTNHGGTSTITESYLQYIYFETEAGLNHWILEKAKEKFTSREYKVIHVRPVEVELQTTVRIKD